jgi:streptogramin lyase
MIFIRQILAVSLAALAVGLLVTSPRTVCADDVPGQASAVGTIETIAGSEKAGYEGDNGAAKAALLSKPFHCELDGNGNLLFADTMNHRIRKIDLKTGVISNVAGNGEKGSGGDGGPAPKASIDSPYALAFDRTRGDLYIVEQRTAVIRKIGGKTGIITTVAGNGSHTFSGDGGPATAAGLVEPNDCCLDGKDGLLIADVAGWRVRRVDLKTGLISTFAGTGRPTDASGKLRSAKTIDRAKLGDGGKATEAILIGPRGVCVDASGNTFICEREGNAVRKVDEKGMIATIAGTGVEGYTGDGGPAAQATFKSPKGIRSDKHGNLYVVDADNHAIRKIEAATNRITTVAGGRQGAQGDGGDARQAGLDKPHGCVLDQDGTLYIADSWNNRIRRVSYAP